MGGSLGHGSLGTATREPIDGSGPWGGHVQGRGSGKLGRIVAPRLDQVLGVPCLVLFQTCVRTRAAQSQGYYRGLPGLRTPKGWVSKLPNHSWALKLPPLLSRDKGGSECGVCLHMPATMRAHRLRADWLAQGWPPLCCHRQIRGPAARPSVRPDPHGPMSRCRHRQPVRNGISREGL